MSARLLFLLLCVLIAPTAKAGFDRGNAGDAFSAEFILTAQDLVQRMRASDQVLSLVRHWVQPDQLETAILNTKVRSESALQLKGNTVDAINLPDVGMIILNRDRWSEYRTPSEIKARLTLVLHEYLGILGADDGQFQITGQVLSFIDTQSDGSEQRWAPLNPVNLVSMINEQAPERCILPDIEFDPSRPAESLNVTSVGDCGASYRKVVITKNAEPESAGLSHRFDIQVYNQQDMLIGDLVYEPEWGKCLLPGDGTCQLSGELTIANVSFIFWYRRQ